MSETKPDPKKKPGFQEGEDFKSFSDPACEVREGKRVAPTAQVWEPHAYNRKLLESQRARGVPANIPKVPLAKTHTTAIKKPKMTDLVAKAKAMKAAQAAMAAEIEGVGGDILPGDSIEFDELGQ